MCSPLHTASADVTRVSFIIAGTCDLDSQIS